MDYTYIYTYNSTCNSTLFEISNEMEAQIERKCMYCDKPLLGRVDKMFCDSDCRAAYHYRLSREKEQTLFSKIDTQLKLNRNILKHYNQAGKSVVRKDVLMQKGFNPKYFTHYWKNKKGEVYLFCYEYGFLGITDNDKDKYLLVQWQTYME